MAIETICSGCGKRLAVGDEFAGRRARCPSCGQIYTVPGAISATGPSGAVGSLPGNNPELHETEGYRAGTPISSSSAFSQPGNSLPSDRFWMKATNGQEYGPVDRVALDRWFAEGRIGPGYQIRSSEYGDWQPAVQFEPTAQSANPFSDQPYLPTGSVGTHRQWPKSDNSGIILAMGILSWVVCPICGIIAWVMGGQALKDMQNGLADPSSRGMVQVGYYLGMVHVILAICCFGFYVVIIGLAAVGGNFN